MRRRAADIARRMMGMDKAPGAERRPAPKREPGSVVSVDLHLRLGVPVEDIERIVAGDEKTERVLCRRIEEHILGGLNGELRGLVKGRVEGAISAYKYRKFVHAPTERHYAEFGGPSSGPAATQVLADDAAPELELVPSPPEVE